LGRSRFYTDRPPLAGSDEPHLVRGLQRMVTTAKGLKIEPRET
jgi:hypothetical protein